MSPGGRPPADTPRHAFSSAPWFTDDEEAEVREAIALDGAKPGVWLREAALSTARRRIRKARRSTE